jgi:hypothetical protein
VLNILRAVPQQKVPAWCASGREKKLLPRMVAAAFGDSGDWINTFAMSFSYLNLA